jgi:hypothetical protein
MNQGDNAFRVSNRFGYAVEFSPLEITMELRSEYVFPFLHTLTGIQMQGDPQQLSNKPITEGSFSQAWIVGNTCCRFTRSQEGTSIISRIVESLHILLKTGILTHVHGYGYVVDSSGRQLGLLLIMESLNDLDPHSADEKTLYSTVAQISQFGFHNDLKIDNIMQRGPSDICVIDFDLFSPTKLVVALSGTSFIELDIEPFMHTVSDPDTFIQALRLFYDYTCLSLSINKSHPLYEPVLKRLVLVFNQLQTTNLLSNLLTFLGESQARDIPVEVLVRCPDGIEAVSVNIFDLKGNAFAHGVSDWDSYPSLFRSTGVYWPDR